MIIDCTDLFKSREIEAYDSRCGVKYKDMDKEDLADVVAAWEWQIELRRRAKAAANG